MAGPLPSSCSAGGVLDGVTCEAGELDSAFPDSKHNGLALMILCAESVVLYTAKALLGARMLGSCCHHCQPLDYERLSSISDSLAQCEDIP